ncbi:phosphotransferase [Streptomyces sp. RB6PN25]|uniref:Maltokinase n=1 Tax=Streptomyces humicola TaxID=2953240 RepID=A0ABT1PTL7_9ACTN|nr:phosphotransferase [Streptomyces humicola]MCQ4080468.1 phosphotransferase [Streptomyces humicola]
MSDTSWLRPITTVTSAARASAPEASGLLRSLTPLLREWLPRQRWFAGKGRPITGFGLVCATELLPADGGADAPALLHLLLDVHQPDCPPDCYQLLVGTRELLPPALASALIGRAVGGRLDGLTLYEGLHDPRLATLLLERMRTSGSDGHLRFSAEPDAVIPSGLAPRLSVAEQSNSSVIYGDTFILKLFRRISPGCNPDLELSLALARVGSARVAAPVAWFEATGLHEEPATLGVLQRYLPGSSDGWELALRAVDGAVAGADFTDHARALGRATAEVHTALADALPTTLLRRPQIQRLATSMAERLDATVAAVPALAPYRTGLLDAFRDLVTFGSDGGTVRAQRIHGDLHLGQALWTPAQGWVLIDFEGEPARPLTERRRPHSPVQDVAGMLRSFDYAARHRDPASPYAAEWADRHRAAFVAGYAERSGSDPNDSPVLLRAYETDKAVYEVVYEARHRPDWLPIPMAAIERLCRPAAPFARLSRRTRP